MEYNTVYKSTKAAAGRKKDVEKLKVLISNFSAEIFS